MITELAIVWWVSDVQAVMVSTVLGKSASQRDRNGNRRQSGSNEDCDDSTISKLLCSQLESLAALFCIAPF